MSSQRLLHIILLKSKESQNALLKDASGKHSSMLPLAPFKRLNTLQIFFTNDSARCRLQKRPVVTIERLFKYYYSRTSIKGSQEQTLGPDCRQPVGLSESPHRAVCVALDDKMGVGSEACQYVKAVAHQIRIKFDLWNQSLPCISSHTSSDR